MKTLCAKYLAESENGSTIAVGFIGAGLFSGWLFYFLYFSASCIVQLFLFVASANHLFFFRLKRISSYYTACFQKKSFLLTALSMVTQTVILTFALLQVYQNAEPINLLT